MKSEISQFAHLLCKLGINADGPAELQINVNVPPKL